MQVSCPQRVFCRARCPHRWLGGCCGSNKQGRRWEGWARSQVGLAELERSTGQKRTLQSIAPRPSPAAPAAAAVPLRADARHRAPRPCVTIRSSPPVLRAPVVQEGSKPIFHLEAFLARFMSNYKQVGVYTRSLHMRAGRPSTTASCACLHRNTLTHARSPPNPHAVHDRPGLLSSWCRHAQAGGPAKAVPVPQAAWSRSTGSGTSSTDSSFFSALHVVPASSFRAAVLFPCCLSHMQTRQARLTRVWTWEGGVWLRWRHLRGAGSVRRAGGSWSRGLCLVNVVTARSDMQQAPRQQLGPPCVCGELQVCKQQRTHRPAAAAAAAVAAEQVAVRLACRPKAP